MSEPRHGPDALYRNVSLPYTVTLPVLGIPVRFESNSRTALGVIEGAYGRWRSLDAAPGLVGQETVCVRLIVHVGDEGGAKRPPMTYRMPDADRIIVATPGSFGIGDASRREGVAYVTRDLLAEPDHLRYGLLDAITLVLVTKHDRTPVHASVVMRGGTALVLAGPSGTGKSTLAYAALRAGMNVLTDDAAYIQTEPEFRLWGMPGLLNLPPDARDAFPELRDRVPRLLANGKEKIVVDVRTETTGDDPPVAARAGVCLLTRDGGAASLVPASRREVDDFLTRGLDVSRGLYEEFRSQAIARLSDGGGWRLNLSSDPADGVRFLAGIFEELE